MILTDDEIAELIFGAADDNDLSIDQLTLGQLSVATAEAAVIAHVGDDLASKAREEVLAAGDRMNFSGLLQDRFNPDNGDVLVLTHAPVQTSGIIVKVNETKQDFTGASALSSDEYQLEDVAGGYSSTGILRRIGRQWPQRPGGVLVTYTGGLDVSGSDYSILKKAIAEVAKLEYTRHRSFMESAGGEDTEGRPVSSESIGSYSVSYDAKMAAGQGAVIPAHVYAMLDRIRNYGDLL